MGQSLGRSLGNVDYKLHRGQLSFKWILGITFLFVFPMMMYAMFASGTKTVHPSGSNVNASKSTETTPAMDVTVGSMLVCIIGSLLLSLLFAGIYQFSMSVGYGRAQSMCKGRKDYEACVQQQFNKQDIMGAVNRRRYY